VYIWPVGQNTKHTDFFACEEGHHLLVSIGAAGMQPPWRVPLQPQHDASNLPLSSLHARDLQEFLHTPAAHPLLLSVVAPATTNVILASLV
jgi:hypothetical protein